MSQPRFLHASLNDSISSGRFIDTKFYVFSCRDQSGRVGTPKALFANSCALAAVPYGPIEPIPSIGVTTRVDWLPTQLQVNFLRLIRKQMTTSLTPVKELRRAS